MAVVEVSISSCCTIKPSSATPPHLRTWKLSMLDQIFPNFHVPFILFYSPSSSHPPAAIVAHLKLSLSHALTKYYPLAGRLDEPNYTVDCCDQGINFFEAQAHGNLLRNPGPDLRRQLAPPAGDNTTGYLEGVLLAVQATVFNCGGVSLGLSISHKIADGVSLFSFLRTWATSTTTQSGREDVVLESCYFPPLEYLEPELYGRPTERTVQHRFVIDGPRLTALRSASGSADATHFPRSTRVEVITGLFWSAIIRARANLGPSGKGLVVHMVNLRKYMAEPVSETLLGNFSIPVVMTEAEGEDRSWRKLGLKLSTMRQQLNYEKLQAARGPGRLQFLGKLHEDVTRLPIRCAFSSWCQFPVYEIDFGWGKPAWAAFGGPVMKHAVFMVDMKDNDGVEVWVSMEHEEMERLLRDQELLSHVSTFPAESLYIRGEFNLSKL